MSSSLDAIKNKVPNEKDPDLSLIGWKALPVKSICER